MYRARSVLQTNVRRLVRKCIYRSHRGRKISVQTHDEGSVDHDVRSAISKYCFAMCQSMQICSDLNEVDIEVPRTFYNTAGQTILCNATKPWLNWTSAYECAPFPNLAWKNVCEIWRKTHNNAGIQKHRDGIVRTFFRQRTSWVTSSTATTAVRNAATCTSVRTTRPRWKIRSILSRSAL